VHVKLLLTLLLLAGSAVHSAEYLAFSGGYTSGAAKGIYTYRFDPSNGLLKLLGVAAETDNPSFLILDAKRHLLFSVNEGRDGAVSSFGIDEHTGKLALINRISSRGSSPCHLALDHTGKWLAVANYSSGSVAVLPVAQDGVLGDPVAFDQHHGSGANPARQEGPHAHSVVFSPDNRFLLVNDLGTDEIFVYRFDAAHGTIKPNEPAAFKTAPGAGPRHLVFHPNGKIVYTVNEINSTVTAFHYDPAKGTLEAFQSVPLLPADFHDSSTAAEIVINHDGTDLYASNRGHDSIALFSIDPERFTLSFKDRTPTLGRTPRHFTLDPTGKWMIVANQDTGNIVVFAVHPRTGQLTPANHEPVEVPAQTCFQFVAP
jgi:6-phosphogluconolactonase